MKTIDAYFHIHKGRLNIYNREVLDQQIKDEGFVNFGKLSLEYGNKRTGQMNRYAFGGIINPAVVRLNQDGWDYSKASLYREIEETYCKREMVNEQSGEVREYIKPLKTMDGDEFMDVMYDFRAWFHSQFPDTYLKEPYEYYGMSYTDYGRWKRGDITFDEALKGTAKEPAHA